MLTHALSEHSARRANNLRIFAGIRNLLVRWLGNNLDPPFRTFLDGRIITLRVTAVVPVARWRGSGFKILALNINRRRNPDRISVRIRWII